MRVTQTVIALRGARWSEGPAPFKGDYRCPKLRVPRKTWTPHEAVKPADCSPEQRIEQRYLATVDALFDDALDQDSVYILSDALVWTLARVIDACGTTYVAGDVLAMLGKYVRRLAEEELICDECKRAMAEAEQARKEERQPQ